MINVAVNSNGCVLSYDSTVSDSVKFEKIKFSFPDSWEGYTKTAVFRHEEIIVNVVLNDGEDECFIPHEVIKAPEFTVSVFGILGDSRATSTQARIRVKQSGYAEGDEPSDPTPTAYEQLITLANETKQIAQSVRTDADNGAFNGEKGDKGDPGDIENIDQTYSPTSENAQSGTAVAEAISSTQDKYEFITEITLTEDSIIEIQFETPMKAVRITSNNIAVPSSGTYVWRLNGNNNSGSVIPVIRPNTSLSTSCEYFAEIYFDNGMLFSRSMKVQNVYVGSNVFGGFHKSPMFQNITSLRTSLEHLADSKLKIWGVKA